MRKGEDKRDVTPTYGVTVDRYWVVSVRDTDQTYLQTPPPLRGILRGTWGRGPSSQTGEGKGGCGRHPVDYTPHPYGGTSGEGRGRCPSIRVQVGRFRETSGVGTGGDEGPHLPRETSSGLQVKDKVVEDSNPTLLSSDHPSPGTCGRRGRARSTYGRGEMRNAGETGVVGDWGTLREECGRGLFCPR